MNRRGKGRKEELCGALCVPAASVDLARILVVAVRYDGLIDVHCEDDGLPGLMVQAEDGLVSRCSFFVLLTDGCGIMWTCPVLVMQAVCQRGEWRTYILWADRPCQSLAQRSRP
jgi:hypothetical protein